MQDAIFTMITPALAMIFTVVFAVLWWRERKRFILAYCLGFGGLVAGFFVSVLVDWSNPILHWNIIKLLGNLGAIAIVWGAATRLSQRSPMLAYVAIVVISSIIMSAGLYLENKYVSMLAENASSGMIFLFGAMVLWTARGDHVLDRALVWIIGLTGVHGLTRPLEFMLIDPVVADHESLASAFHATNILLLAVLAATMAMTMLAQLIVDKARSRSNENEYDSLCGLPNRPSFERDATLLSAKANAEGKDICLIVADIDHFKTINDTWGHSVGDLAIAGFGRMIADKIRPTDLAGRIGGEEFCIAVWGCNLTHAVELADRIRLATLDLQSDVSNRDVKLSASFGVATWLPGEPYSNVFKRADTALYAAKNAGRNQVCADNALRRRSSDQVQTDEHSDNVISLVK